MLGSILQKIKISFSSEKHIAPLAVLRMAFGFVMLISTLRFIAKGWVRDFYIKPKFHFPFYGFEWIKPLPAIAMYAVFALMAVACLFIIIGLFYRLSITTFLLCFLYIELIDKTYYLNHYYFVSIFTFLLMLVPAQRYFSLDVLRKPSIKVTQVPAWTINIFKAQLFLVYFLAGVSKLNYDWLFNAMPLRMWLPAKSGLPLIGAYLCESWAAYVACWFGAVFDLAIGFLLLYKPTRKAGYLFVIIFHLFTGWLFKIGMFPFIMIATTTIFFSENFHNNFIYFLRRLFRSNALPDNDTAVSLHLPTTKKRFIYSLLILYAVVQIVLPFRYILYPGKLLWTEEGYRFSWRVMLMEKGGTTYFYIRDSKTQRQWEVINSEFLTPFQEHMMETQPDMILQFAHYLHDVYLKKGINDPIVTVESYVTLNGSGSRLYIDPKVNLAKEKETFLPKKWILPFH
jgi:hypothetical protein